MPLDWQTVMFNLAMFAYCVGSFFFIRKFKHHIWSYFLVGVLYIAYVLFVDFKLCITLWQFLSLASYALFLYGSALLAICAYFSWTKFKVLRTFFSCISVILVVVAIDAFGIEPHWLSVREVNMGSSNLTRPLKIAVIADIQTDTVGDYERDALQRVKQYQPDIVLFAGDYIQLYDEGRPKQIELLNNILKETNLNPPLGTFVARGDCDRVPDWAACFEGLPYKIFEDSRTTVKSGDITVTVLNLDNSRYSTDPPPAVEGFHIVLGHAPDFAMKQPKADLLVAGHTHGGQFQIPFFGPIMTFSTVPRQWGGGCMTDIGNGAMLCISRGVGMERHLAPRLRFFCRPELVFINVVPVIN